MLADLLNIIYWWFILFVIGIIFLPLAKMIFGKFWDGGYIFSKVIGLATIGYVSWLGASIKIIPFGRWSILVTMLLVFAVIWWRRWDTLREYFVEKKLAILTEEVLFLVVMLFWAYLRGLNPDANSLEKFMDLGFVNSITRAKYMPPPDMWYAGNTINYYYFGHYLTAMVAKLSGIKTGVMFNLMLATIAGLGFGMAFSIGSNLFCLWKKNRKWIIGGGLVTSLLFAFGGNLHTFVFAMVLPALRKFGIYHGTVGRYWYADATRYIGYNPPTNDKTIHEFPNYSFTVADLHGHVLGIIIVMTIIGVLLTIAVKEKKDKFEIFHPVEYLVLALLLAVAGMTNFWDFPIYVGLTGLVVLVKNLRQHEKWSGIKYWLFGMVKIVGFGIILMLPFLAHFKNISEGIRFVEHRSYWYQLLVLWGSPVFVGLVFLFKKIQTRSWSLKEAAMRQKLDYFALAAFLWAVFLVILPEVIFVKDIYTQGYARANTMFKLTFQAYIIFSLVTVYLAVRGLSELRLKLTRMMVSAIFSVMILAVMIYPFYAVPGFYGDLKPANYKGLDGTKFVSLEDKQIIAWFNKNIIGQPVILEADGDSYSEYGRISVLTGLPTVAGWLVHEWLWRGGYNAPAKRSEDIKKIYELDNIKETGELLRNYKVKYIIISGMEREKFPEIKERKLESFGKIVFRDGEVKIIELN